MLNSKKHFQVYSLIISSADSIAFQKTECKEKVVMQVTLKTSEFSLYYILDVPEKASFRRLPFYCCRFVFMIQINFSVDLQLINYVISETMHIVWLKLHNYSCRKRCEIELVIVVKKMSSKFFFFVFCYSAFPCSHLNIHSALKMASYLICCKLLNIFSS